MHREHVVPAGIQRPRREMKRPGDLVKVWEKRKSVNRVNGLPVRKRAVANWVGSGAAPRLPLPPVSPSAER